MATDMTIEVRVGARLQAIVRAFEVLHAALVAHGHVFTADEEAALLAAADAVEEATDAGR